MEEEQLRAVVEAQAEARIGGDLVGFASRMTPQALLRLHRTGSGPRDVRSRRYEVVALDETGESATSEVRFHGRGSYVLRSHWERRDGHWMATLVERPADLNRRAWWQRVVGALVTFSGAPERRDLQ